MAIIDIAWRIISIALNYYYYYNELDWDVLPDAVYSPDLALICNKLIRSLEHFLLERVQNIVKK